MPEGTLKQEIVDGIERELIEQVMRQCKGVQVSAAKRLGINRNTLHKKLDEYSGKIPQEPEAAVAERSPAARG